MIFAIAFSIAALSAQLPQAQAKVNPIEITQKTAEQQVRHLLEPLLERYCREECKLMSVNVSVDLASSDMIAPGFEDYETKRDSDLAPSGAAVKILINDKIGPVSRKKLLDLVQQYLDTLDYPVKIETQIAHFPMPQGSETKISELRERISKQFKDSIEDLLRQFCPEACMLGDYSLQTELVNGEETQYGSAGEFMQEGDTAIRIRNISATLLMDQSLTRDEQANILEMAKLKVSYFKNVAITGKSMKFPQPMITQKRANRHLAGDLKGDEQQTTNSKTATQNKESTNSEQTNNKEEKYSRIEKIERVENGDAVQAELKNFKIFGLIFACSVLALLIFIAISTLQTGKKKDYDSSSLHKIVQTLTTDPLGTEAALPQNGELKEQKATMAMAHRYEIERLQEELTLIFGNQPKVAKYVFAKVLTEEGVETTAEYVHIFGEGIVVDMLRDPSLQTDLAELMEYYAKNPLQLTDEHKLDLLRRLHSRTISGKLAVLGNRSSNLFDFLAEMDGLQILELIRTESLTVKSIVLTQCDSQKRSVVYSMMEPEIRLKLLTELSRIDYLPRDYIFNVANALKRKRRENPKLNTEALPGSEVLVSLLERTGHNLQMSVVRTLEATNPDSARTVKSKLVSVDTLKFLRDNQLLEVVLSLKHEELIQFLKGAPEEVRKIIFAKAPKDLVFELEEEIEHAKAFSKEIYATVERKVLNRMKVMATDGQINLIETNDRMFSEQTATPINKPPIAPGTSAPKGAKAG